MSGATRPYIVRQGDYLDKIAAHTGYRADEIWDHPKNDPLRQAGRTKDVLHPGDVVHVPEATRPTQRVSLGTENSYEGTVPRVPVKLVFKIGAQPRAHQDYEVTAVGETLAQGTTDGDGALSFEVPVDVIEVSVIFTEPFAVYALRVGGVDPVRERSGVVGRLRQLGYLPKGEMASDEEVSEALGRFQADHRLAVTGAADQATRDRLVQEFGS